MGKALDKSAQIRCLEKLYAFRANYQELNGVDSPFLQAMAPKVFQNSQWLPLVAEQEDCQWNKLERHLQPFCSLKETLMDSPKQNLLQNI